MLSAIATDIKDFSLSPDGSEAKFTLVTKYAGDISVTLPAKCLKNLQSVPGQAPDLSVGRAAGGAAERQASDVTVQPGNGAPSGVAVSVPKTWLVGADEKHGFVIVVLNLKTAGQYGFALQPKGAEEVALALKKQADALALKKRTAAPPTSN